MNPGKIFLFRIVVLFLAVLCAGVDSATAAEPDGPIASPEKDWPQWRGPRRDGISTETGLLQSWPADGPKLLWKTESLGLGWSSPIIVGESMYLTGDSENEVKIFCLDLNGKVKWTAKNGTAWTPNYKGSRASCTYSEGVIYHMNAHGRVAAFESATGRELWHVPNMLEKFESKSITWGLSECLLIDGQKLWITPGGPKALMVALDKKTGETLLTSELIPGETSAYASPLLVKMGGRRVILGSSSHHGFGIDADSGKLLWKVPVRNTWGATCFQPVFAESGVFYAAPDGSQGVKHALDFAADPIAKLEWKTLIDPLTGGGIFKDGLLYVNGCKKSRALHALDWKTGASRYELKLSAPTNNHASCALLWADGRLYGLFENGLMALLNPTTDKFEIAGQFKLVDTKKTDAWAHPVVFNGRMYLRYHEVLWCYDVKRPL